jgi:sulfur-carrier protein
MTQRTLRIELPHHLRTLAQVSGEIRLEVEAPVTLARVLDALEARYPVLRGAIRDHDTLKRRPFLRFFVCAEDWSHLPPETLLPEAIADGREPLLIVGAIAGGSWPLRQPRSAQRSGPARSGPSIS